MRVGIPALAGLSILHGLVPPHPGPVAAIDLLNANLGLTLLFGLIVAVPTLIVSGPLLSIPITRWVPVYAREGAIVRSAVGGETGQDQAAPESQSGQDAQPADGGPVRQPSFFASLISIVLAVVLMLVGAIGDLVLDDGSKVRSVTNVLGTPVVALLVAVLVAMFAVGLGSGMDWERVQQSLGAGLPAVAGILLIVAAGGGFKQMLVDSGVANVIADQAKNSSLSPLFLGWLVAVGIRLATGSATVATLTAAGIVSQLAATLSESHDALSGAGHRVRVAVLQPRERRRILARQGVLRTHRGADDQVMVADGDDSLGDGPGLRAASQHHRVIGVPETDDHPAPGGPPCAVSDECIVSGRLLMVIGVLSCGVVGLGGARDVPSARGKDASPRGSRPCWPAEARLNFQRPTYARVILTRR